ncbi:MAG TPA: type II toxin-antitoxin system RelE/ParE family toxin [Pyrinomonadaceae bacterium]|nr:type II toxin-antitoxin system RelE/ParE family toxin [Pyrinomonadaceae bacterium]
MRYRIVVRPEVDTDLIKAEAWYEQQEAGLGRKFLGAVRDAIDRLSTNPLIYQVRSQRKQIRWAYPQRFPYRIIFRVTRDIVVVYAVVHSARQGKPRRLSR